MACSSITRDEEEAAQRALMSLGAQLDEVFNGTNHPHPPDTGFMLLVSYSIGCEDRSSMVSNMAKHDLLAMLKLQVAKLEGQTLQAGHA